MKKNIFILIGVFVIHFGFSQNSNVEILKSELKNSKIDTVVINLYNEIGQAYQNSEVDSAIFYHLKGYKLAKKIHNDLLMIISLRELCWSYFQKGEFELGKKKTFLAIGLTQKSKSENVIKRREELLGALYGNLGNLFVNQGRFNEALKYYFKAYKYYQKVKSDIDQATMLGNIGLVYFNIHDNDKALEYQLQALKISESINDKDGIATRLANIGGIYADNNDNEQALKYYDRSLEIFTKDSNEYAMAILLTNLGFVHNLNKNYKLSLEKLFLAEKYSKRIGDKSNLALTYANLGATYIGLRNFKKAKYYLEISEQLSKELGALDLLKIVYHDLYELYESQGEFEKALSYYKSHIIFLDSVEDKENAEQKIQQEVQFEYDKKSFADSIEYSNQKKIKDAEIEKQKALANQREIEVQAKRKQQYFLFAGLGMFLIFSLLLFNRYKFVQRQKKIIEQKEKETAVQKEIIEDKQKEIIDSINYAKRLQRAILAPEIEIKKYFSESFLLFKPKDIVAGDFYFFEVTDKFIFYAAADCTGHGVPGAMVSVVCSNALTRCVKEFDLKEPGLILDKTRELILETFKKSGEEVKDGMDISFISLNRNTKELKWAGANNPLWFIENGEMKEIKGDKQPIGISDNPKPFTTHTLPNLISTLFLITDGYPDQFGGPKGKKYKYIKLKEFFLSIASLPFNEQKENLVKEFEQWKGALEQVDDVCIIGIRI